MSNKYQLTEHGVINIETGASIPNADGNRHWQEFAQWLAEGNTPRPVQPSVFHEWDEELEVWVEDVVAKERTEALTFLTKTDKDQARTVDDILEYLVNGTPIPQVVLDRKAARADARGRL